MGTWATPNTNSMMAQVEAIMAKPLPAKQAPKVLHGLIGDDTLFDLINAAEDINKKADVRPLVAMTLDEWTNFYAPGQFRPEWENSAIDKAAALAEKFRTADVATLIGCKTLTADGAIANVAGNHRGEMADVAGYEAVPAAGPGAFIVLHRESGKIFRAWCGPGCSYFEADDSIVAQWRERYFPDSPAPAGAQLH